MQPRVVSESPKLLFLQRLKDVLQIDADSASVPTCELV